MKLYVSLLILMIFKHSSANKPQLIDVVADPKKGIGSALLFIVNRTGIRIPLNRKNIEVHHDTEIFYSFCPSSPLESNDESVVVRADEQLVNTPNFEYRCEKEYKPMEAEEEECNNTANLLTFKYRVNYGLEKKYFVHSKEYHDNLFIYRLCIENSNPKQALYATYTPFPNFSTPEKPTIQKAFDDYFADMKEEVKTLYCQKNQQVKFKKIFNGLFRGFKPSFLDNVIPQQLVPTDHLPAYFSNGTTKHPYNYKPQWLSVVPDWDRITRFINKLAEKINFNVYTGTYYHGEKDRIKLESKTNKTTLYIHPIWWILIKTDNNEGVIISMINYPRSLIAEKNPIIPLCGKHTEHTAKVRNESESQDMCDLHGWSEIRFENSINIVNCCEVTGFLTNLLMNKRMALKIMDISGPQLSNNTDSKYVTKILSSSSNTAASSPTNQSTKNTNKTLERSKSTQVDKISFVKKDSRDVSDSFADAQDDSLDQSVLDV